jgi:ParB family chromosome partitioning protein
MDKPKRKLGRGLGSLLPGKKTPTQKTTSEPIENDSNIAVEPAPSGKPMELNINIIQTNHKQPREIFNEESLMELSNSIREQGILQPLVVREINGEYELVAGERRLRASRMAGLESVPVVIMDISDDHMLEAAIVENIQRQDLNVLEVAHAYDALINELSITHEEVAKRLGVSRVSVTNTLRILNLPREVQEIVSRGTISMGHARALLALDTPMMQLSLARKIVKEGLSVREVERIIKGNGPKEKKPKDNSGTEKKNAVLQDYEDKLRQLFGTKVKIEENEGKGKVNIEFYSNEDLGRIINLLGIEVD